MPPRHPVAVRKSLPVRMGELLHNFHQVSKITSQTNKPNFDPWIYNIKLSDIDLEGNVIKFHATTESEWICEIIFQKREKHVLEYLKKV